MNFIIQRMSLKQKATAFTIVLVCITIGFSYALIKSSQDRAENLEEVYVKNMTPMETLYKISEILKDIPLKMALFGMGELPSAGTKNKLEEDQAKISQLWSKFEKIYRSRKHDTEEEKVYLAMTAKYKSFIQFIPRLLMAYEKDDPELVIEMLEEDWPIYQVTLVKNIVLLAEIFRVSTEKTYLNSQTSAKIYLTFSFGFGLVAFIIAVSMGIFLNSKVASPIANICSQLTESADSLIATSDTLLNSSNSMAESSSEQAASIEETSASLEELHGIVKQNVSASEETTTMSRDVQQNASDSNVAMEQLVQSMNEVAEANESIQELVSIISEIGNKTQVIDEIVFQTKLLSFNASVEAERAGEHGRGFAVVAQEVGNLAQMSGIAANEISSIVKESIQKSEIITTDNKQKVSQGNELVKSTANSFSKVTGISKQLAGHSEAILTASKEQVAGLEQITTAMGQLEITTQSNSSTSQETSDASNNVKKMANTLNEIIFNLNKLVS